MFGITMAESGGTFEAPGPNSFDFSEVPLFHLGSLAVTKPMVQLLLGALIVFAFFYAAARRATLVPSRIQFAGERAYRSEEHTSELQSRQSLVYRLLLEIKQK